MCVIIGNKNTDTKTHTYNFNCTDHISVAYVTEWRTE